MQDAFAHCEALVRAADKDRFLAALFAPAEHRGALHALYAFNIEIARVREIIRNPVAAALLAAVARYRLPTELLTSLIAARRFDLYNDPMRKLADFNDYARATSSAVIELSARILNSDTMPGLGQLAL